jgi:hypothetical protein
MAYAISNETPYKDKLALCRLYLFLLYESWTSTKFTYEQTWHVYRKKVKIPITLDVITRLAFYQDSRKFVFGTVKGKWLCTNRLS